MLGYLSYRQLPVELLPNAELPMLFVQIGSPVQVSPQHLANADSAWTSEFLDHGDGFGYVEALRRCLDELEARQRRALDLRYAEKSSRAEMARVLEMTENGVKSLLRRIRAALARCVRRRLDLEEA